MLGDENRDAGDMVTVPHKVVGGNYQPWYYIPSSKRQYIFIFTFLNRHKNTDRVHYINKKLSLLILNKSITGNGMAMKVQVFDYSPNAPK